MEFTAGVPVQRASELVRDVGDDKRLPTTGVKLVDDSWDEDDDRFGAPLEDVGVVVTDERTWLELLIVDEDD